MNAKSLDAHIESTPHVKGGKPRIAGRRIRVEDVVIWHERLGQSVDQIASEYELGLADIHSALAYYHDHREEIDRSIAEGDAFVEAMRRATPSKLAERLQASRD